MLNLAEYRRTTTGLADYLPWACLVAPGIVLNKDGSFQRTLRYRGPDLDSATEAELVAITARLNNVLEALRRGLGAVLRGRARAGQPVSRPRLRRCRLLARRPGAVRRLHGDRRPPREPVLPDLPLPAAARPCGTRGALALRAPGGQRPRHRRLGPARVVRHRDRPRAGAAVRHPARGRGADRCGDARLPARHHLRQAAPRGRAGRSRPTSTPSSPTRPSSAASSPSSARSICGC